MLLNEHQASKAHPPRTAHRQADECWGLQGTAIREADPSFTRALRPDRASATPCDPEEHPASLDRSLLVDGGASLGCGDFDGRLPVTRRVRRS